MLPHVKWSKLTSFIKLFVACGGARPHRRQRKAEGVGRKAPNPLCFLAIFGIAEFVGEHKGVARRK